MIDEFRSFARVAEPEMLLPLSVTGLLLSLILLFFNARRYRSSVFLGSFFFLVSLYVFTQYVLFYSGIARLIAVFYIHPAFLSYLTGPVLYWYVRSTLNDAPHLRRRDLWHLIPSLFFFVTTLPYLFSPWQEKMAIADRIIGDLTVIKDLHPTILYRIIPAHLLYLSRPLLVLAYATAASVLLLRFRIRRRSAAVIERQRYMIAWLSVFLGFLFILIISHLAPIVIAILEQNVRTFFTLNLLQMISGFGLAGLLISPFFFPSILYGMPRIPETHVPPPERPPLVASHTETRRKAPDFESDYLRFIHVSVEACMKEHRAYLEPDCNLARCSKLTELPLHHLAYYFREERKQTFTEYRNTLRVDHAKNMILEGKARELTLEAIGQLSGFSTRNTFFTAFKKAEGVSPGAFLSRSGTQ